MLFISANAGEGTSSIAASFALIAANYSDRMAWLVDLHLPQNAVFQGFHKRFAGDVGAPGRAYDASFGHRAVFQFSPAPPHGGDYGKLLTAHQIGEARLMITRFRNEQLGLDQNVVFDPNSKWWSSLRRAADWIILDSPALSHSAAGLNYIRKADSIVLVVEADKTQAKDVSRLKQMVETRGGHILGIVMNRRREDARFFERLADGYSYNR